MAVSAAPKCASTAKPPSPSAPRPWPSSAQSLDRHSRRPKPVSASPSAFERMAVSVQPVSASPSVFERAEPRSSQPTRQARQRLALRAHGRRRQRSPSAFDRAGPRSSSRARQAARRLALRRQRLALSFRSHGHSLAPIAPSPSAPGLAPLLHYNIVSLYNTRKRLELLAIPVTSPPLASNQNVFVQVSIA